MSVKAPCLILGRLMKTSMNELLAKIIDAHGGMERWNGHEKVDATIVSGGGLFPLKGVPQDSNPRRMTVWLHEERSSVLPYGAARSAHDVHLRQDRHREAQWHAGCRALRPQGTHLLAIR